MICEQGCNTLAELWKALAQAMVFKNGTRDLPNVCKPWNYGNRFVEPASGALIRSKKKKNYSFKIISS
jgi:hypothetical protein